MSGWPDPLPGLFGVRVFTFMRNSMNSVKLGPRGCKQASVKSDYGLAPIPIQNKEPQMKSIQFKTANLLGYRIASQAVAAGGKVGTTLGGKLGGKAGAKHGNKGTGKA